MALKLMLACLIGGCLACGVAAADPRKFKRPRLAAPLAPEQAAPRNPCADPYAVCSAGTYLGRDPDPNVRFQLLLEFESGRS
jgi:hypothetical protein